MMPGDAKIKSWRDGLFKPWLDGEVDDNIKASR
jgi:hypothetical protein